MQPTRRQWLAIASTGIGVGVAGCLSSGSNITYPEPEPDEPEDTNESEEPAEPAEPSVERINRRLAEETDTIYEELRWFETEYESTLTEYKSRVRDVYNALVTLREALASEGRIEPEQLAQVETIATEVASDVNRIPEPQFTGHIDFQAVNSNRFPQVERFRKRSDWDRVDDELRYLSRVYGDASTEKQIQKRYSPNPIENRLYNWFAGEGDGKMLEVRHVSDDPEAHAETNGRLPGHGAYVLADASRAIVDSARELSIIDRPMGGPRWELFESLRRDLEPISEPAGRRYQLYARIHDVGSSGEIDPSETESNLVYGQRYDDPETADTAFTAVMTDKEIEDTIQWGDETWNRILYNHDGDRIYAHFLRADSFLFVAVPSATPWEDRDDDWSAPLAGTWVNP